MLKTLSECDAGDRADFRVFFRGQFCCGMRRKVVMVIKAPRGRAVIFDDRSGRYVVQAEAVRAFVEQHSSGGSGDAENYLVG